MAAKLSYLVRGFTRFLRVSYVWIAILYIYITTFGLILPWLCQGLGFSSYYNPLVQTKEKIDLRNEMRTAKAFKILNTLPKRNEVIDELSSKDPQSYNEKRIKVTFVVVSVNRQAKPHYLVQVVSRLLQQTHAKQHLINSKIIVFNAESNPSDNEDIKSISDYVRIENKLILTHSNSTSNIPLYEKEKVDYMVALNLGLQEKSDYTVIIEDDVLPDINFIENLNFLFKWRIPWLRSSPKWAFIKLYYPEKWQGYGDTEILELVTIYVTTGILSTVMYLKLCKTKQYLVTIFLMFLVSGGYFTGVAYTIGRAHIIELGKILPLFYRTYEAPSCCTPAVLYPMDLIKDLIDFLKKKSCSSTYPLDFALDDFVTSEKLAKYLVSPNMFSHIGFHSSLNKADKDIREFSLLFDP